MYFIELIREVIIIFKKYGIYQKDNDTIVAIDIITGLTYQELEDEGYWKYNNFKADYSLEVDNTRVAIYKVDDIYRYLTNDKIKDPLTLLVLYKDLKDWGGMKSMKFSELDEWEMVK